MDNEEPITMIWEEDGEIRRENVACACWVGDNEPGTLPTGYYAYRLEDKNCTYARCYTTNSDTTMLVIGGEIYVNPFKNKMDRKMVRADMIKDRDGHRISGM